MSDDRDLIIDGLLGELAEAREAVSYLGSVEWALSSAVVRVNQMTGALKSAGLPVPEFRELRGRDWTYDPVRLALIDAIKSMGEPE